MRRIASVLVLVALALACVACGGGSGSSGSGSGSGSGSSGGKPAQPAARETLVVYFSCTGHTKGLAEDVADLLKADLFEIQPEIPYAKEDLVRQDESARAATEQRDEKARPAIRNRIEKFDQYKTIVVAYPIWFGQAPRIIYTFMESYNFVGKTILPMCTSDGSDLSSSSDALRQLTTSATWLKGRSFPGGITKSDLKKVLQQAHLL